jgi:hypothetical protein
MMEYVDKSDFQLTEVDTDSMYMGLSADNLDDIIKPEKKLMYNAHIYKRCFDGKVEAKGHFWFPRKCCIKHSLYDKRTPGLMKEEARGDLQISLCSKTYLLRTEDGSFKLSSKGISKKFLTNVLEKYEKVITTGISEEGMNKGFRAKGNTIFTYNQVRSGFSYFYCKRQVVGDKGLYTRPLPTLLSPWPDHNRVCFDEQDMRFGPMRGQLVMNGITFLHPIHALLYSQSLAIPSLATAIAKQKDVEDMLTLIYKTDASCLGWSEELVRNMETVLRCAVEQDGFKKSILEVYSKSPTHMNKKYVYCSPNRHLHHLSCGLSKEVAELVHPDSYAGKNIIGEIYRKLIKEASQRV